MLAILCLAGATAAATDYAGADANASALKINIAAGPRTDLKTDLRIDPVFAIKSEAVSEPKLPKAEIARPAESMVVALALTTSSPSISSPPPASPRISAPSVPAPARFFTINEVMAKRNGNAVASKNPNVQLAAVDPSQTATDADPGLLPRDKTGKEPFGLFTFVAPDGLLWTKWRKVESDTRAADPILARCLADAKDCSPAAGRFRAIVDEARGKTGRVQFDLVNRLVNNAIRYKSDYEQWGVADRWSTPLDHAGTGSFDTGFGDCEDFAIAKYAALRAAGVPAKQLRILLVHDRMARMDHAVLAALDDGRWFILDNRWMIVIEDNEARQFAPLFVLDEQGVKLLAAPYAEKEKPAAKRKTARAGEQSVVPGGAAAVLPPAGEVTGIRELPVLL